jgi:hypothetical protein
MLTYVLSSCWCAKAGVQLCCAVCVYCAVYCAVLHNYCYDYCCTEGTKRFPVLRLCCSGVLCICGMLSTCCAVRLQ